MKQEDIEKLAARLGADASEKIDADRVAERVLARLRDEGDTVHPRPSRAAPVRRLIQAAAVVALFLVGTMVLRNRGVDRTMASSDVVVPLALDELTVGELDEVLDSLRFDGPVYEIVATGLDALDEAELQELLVQMEGA